MPHLNHRPRPVGPGLSVASHDVCTNASDFVVCVWHYHEKKHIISGIIFGIDTSRVIIFMMRMTIFGGVRSKAHITGFGGAVLEYTPRDSEGY
jgi:hypothetical protein